MQNERLDPTGLMPWLRVAPSSPVAAAPIIILTDKLTKEEMDEILEEAFNARGINPKRTRVGWDVVCRVGDPCSVHDLVRVNAHEATSIITMMTKDDLLEDELSGGKIKNGATIRTTLALRHLLLSSRKCVKHLERDKVRIVLQLTEQCKFTRAFEFR